MAWGRRKDAERSPALDGGYTTGTTDQKVVANEKTVSSSFSPSSDGEAQREKPQHNLRYRNKWGRHVNKHIKEEGESGRKYFHPLKFFRIIFRSSCKASMFVNLLWPFVPIAIVTFFLWQSDPLAQDPAITDLHHKLIFAFAYIAMLPAANLLGFAGQEFARKLPHVVGLVVETMLGSAAEIILFLVLVVNANKHKDKGAENGSGGTEGGNGYSPEIEVIQAAILGSILANLLFCLGLCFFVGGLRREEQRFNSTVSETGSGLMLVAGFGLLIPSAFKFLDQAAYTEVKQEALLESNTLKISRISSILLVVCFGIYLYFQLRTHHSVLDEIYEADEQNDADRHKDLVKQKLTLTECVIALVIAISCVAIIAVALVDQIPRFSHTTGVGGIQDNFMGFILVPLVEKLAEHITAADEAWDDQMNFAVSHILSSTIQTALFNAPLVIFVAWGLDVKLDLAFEPFFVVVLILGILVVGNFLRDGSSNYLEGALCMIVYVIIAVATWYYLTEESIIQAYANDPNLTAASTSASAESAAATTTAAAARLVKRMM